TSGFVRWANNARERAKRGSTSPLLDAKIDAPSAPKLTSPDGAADPPHALCAFLSSIKHRFLFGASEAADRRRAAVCELLPEFRHAPRLRRSIRRSAIFAQLSELGAGAVGLRRLLSQLGVVAVCLFFFPNLFCCLRGAIQPSESPRIDFQCRFFFQAEDGIRVLTVTGVQTCALPI